MARAAVAGALVLIAILSCPARVPAQTGSSSSAPGMFRSGAELVVLQVTVLDGLGRYVPRLRAEDFAVFEDGAPQTITHFSTATAPVDLMLLIDTSASMAERLDAAQHAAIDLVRTRRSDERTAVVSFSDRVRVVQPLTSDVAAVENAIRSTVASGGTALHDALYIALRELARGRRASDARTRRQALVLLSDGEDTASRNALLDEVRVEAQSSGLTIFAIMPASTLAPSPFDVLTRNPSAAFDMRALAEETGGRALIIAGPADLASVYMKIAEELGQQYSLAYAPAGAGRPGYRHVSVRIVGNSNYRARTREGYYATRPIRGSHD